jgi:hypothetical protein
MFSLHKVHIVDPQHERWAAGLPAPKFGPFTCNVVSVTACRQLRAADGKKASQLLSMIAASLVDGAIRPRDRLP